MFEDYQAALAMLDGLSSSTYAAIFVGLFTIFYFIFKLYRHANRYQNIDDNEILKLKLKAARLKQQELYLEHLKQQAESNSNEEESTDGNLNKNGSSHHKNNKDEPLNDYFPLASGGSQCYRPARKRACGPCGGGGCG